MTLANYTSYGVTLTAGQIKKFKKAHHNRLDVTIKLSKENLNGNEKIYLTETQINKIKNIANVVQLKLSKSQLDYMEKAGGFLLLLAAIPEILGAVGGLAGGVTSAVNFSRQTDEQKRHN